MVTWYDLSYSKDCKDRLIKTYVYSYMAHVEIRDLEENLMIVIFYLCHHQSSSELYGHYQYFSYCSI